MKFSLTSLLAIALASKANRVTALLPLANEILEETTDAVDSIVEETTDAVDSIVEETTDAVDNIIEETTDAVDSFFEEIKNQCIVRLDDALEENAVMDIVDGLVGTLADASILHTYSGAINGFTVSLPCSLAQTVLAGVAGIVDLEPDQMVTVERQLIRKGERKKRTRKDLLKQKRKEFNKQKRERNQQEQERMERNRQKNQQENRDRNKQKRKKRKKKRGGLRNENTEGDNAEADDTDTTSFAETNATEGDNTDADDTSFANTERARGGSTRGGDTTDMQGSPNLNIARIGGARDGTGKTAWVLDTGIYLNHPNLNVDASRGFTAYSESGGSDATLNDTNGHGTHVAGTIGATPINGNIVAVAPGTKVVPVKVMTGDGGGSLSAILAGIDHVAKNARPGDCVNLSLCAGGSQTLDDAVIRAAANTGAYWTLAAGNYNADTRNYSPARTTGKNVFTISAVDDKDRLAPFSNFGSAVDYAAPGVNILSAWINGGTSIKSGTSMAAPAACAVLMMTGGNPRTDGFAQDKDSIPDPIIHF